MWPIGLAIIAFIAIYTYINIAYRKDGKAYEPFQSMLERQNAPVEKNFYDWWGLKAERGPDDRPIADAIEAEASAEEEPLEELLPLRLQYYIASRPILVPGPVHIEAPRSLTAGEPLRLRLHLPSALAQDERLMLLSFYKDGELFLLPTLFVEELADADQALASDAAPLAFDIPSDPIETGTVRATLVSEGFVTRWEMQATAP